MYVPLAVMFSETKQVVRGIMASIYMGLFLIRVPFFLPLLSSYGGDVVKKFFKDLVAFVQQSRAVCAIVALRQYGEHL